MVGETISRSVTKKDHAPKMSGRSLYVDDLVMDDMLYGKLLHSAKAKAKIKAVEVPELPAGYLIVDRHDVTGDNKVAIVKDDTPVYAEDTVEYIGEPILMVVGPDERETERLLSEIVVVYEELTPVLDVLRAETVFLTITMPRAMWIRHLQRRIRFIRRPSTPDIRNRLIWRRRD